MRKAAIFVEGVTEQLLIVDLLRGLVGARGIEIECTSQFQNKVVIKSAPTVHASCEFYVLVVNCAGDEQVKSQIIKNYPSLVKAGYTSIIGLRDAYPYTLGDVPMLTKHLRTKLPTGKIAAQMHLAVMEVEAWFLAELTHFPRYHPKLDVPFVVSNGFQIDSQHPEGWAHPAGTLNSIYKAGGAPAYLTSKGKKTSPRIKRTLKALSIEELYLTVRSKAPRFDGFVQALEHALF